MEFFWAAAVLLTCIFLASLLFVQLASALTRLWSWWFSWRASRRRSLRCATFRTASMRRYARGRGQSPSLGALRFTKSRVQEFDGPPDSHGG